MPFGTFLPDEYYDADIHIAFNEDGQYDQQIFNYFQLIRECWKKIHGGHTEKYFELASIYRDMDGMWDGDDSMALKYYKLAAENGYIEAMKCLGDEFCEMENPSESVKYYKMAIEHGDLSVYPKLVAVYDMYFKPK
jgi:TPR repeat protein